MERPLLAAVLIVKNEASVIKTTLESLAPFVDRMVVVVDEASADETFFIASSYPNARVFHAPFKDYATSRNVGLEYVESSCPTIFSLSLSADETLVGGKLLRDFLEANRNDTAGAYCVMMRSGPRQWPFPRILRTGAGWKYVNNAGNRHESPVGPGGEEIHAKGIPDVFVVHEESNPQRKLERLREHDLPDLTAVVADESRSLSERLESMLQLAETHFVIGQDEHKNNNLMQNLEGRWLSHFFASMAMYTRFAGIAETFANKMKEVGEADWQFLFQKAMYAQLMYLQVAETFGLFEPTELVKRLKMVATLAPQLPEAHWALARNLAKVDVRNAIPAALHSAKVARLVYDRPVLGPVDTTIEWQSYRLAAECARLIKDKRLQSSFVKQALLAGAPPESVASLADLA